jgi:hypothetical protein
VQLRPDVLLQVGDQLEVQRLDELAPDQTRELVWRREDHVELEAAGAELGEGLVERVEGGDADAHALLLAERLDDRRVEVVGVVVDLQLAAALGLRRALDRLAAPRQDDRVVLARQRDAGAVDGPARGGIAQDARAFPPTARGSHRRRGVLAAGQRRADARGEGECPSAAQQGPSRYALRRLVRL